MSFLARFIFNFKTTGLEGLIRTRSVIKGVGEQSYISLNAMARQMSSLEKSTLKTSRAIERGFGGLTSTFSRLNGSMNMLSFYALTRGLHAFNSEFIEANSIIQTNRIVLEELLHSKSTAGKFVEGMQQMSANYGYSMSEVTTSSRSLLEVLNQFGQVSPTALQKAMKLGMLLDVMRGENRGLAYSMFAIKEMFQGTGGQDFKSLSQRGSVTLHKKDKAEITRLIKSGDVEGAVDASVEAFKKIGLGFSILDRLAKEGFAQNLNKASKYASRIFQELGASVQTHAIPPLLALNEVLLSTFQDEGKHKILLALGESLARSFDPFFKYLTNFGHAISRNTNLVKFTENLKEIGRNIRGFGNLFSSFFHGLFAGGGSTAETTNNNIEKMIVNMGYLKEQGKKMQGVFRELYQPLTEFGTALHNIFHEIFLFISGAGGLASALKPLIQLATIPLNSLAMVATMVNKITGNDEQTRNNGGKTTTQEYISNGLTALMVMAMFRGRGGKLPKGGIAGAEAEVAQANAIKRVRTRGIEGERAEYLNLLANKTSKAEQAVTSSKYWLKESRRVNSVKGAKIDEKLAKIEIELASKKEKLLKAQQNPRTFDYRGNKKDLPSQTQALNATRAINELKNERKNLLKKRYVIEKEQELAEKTYLLRKEEYAKLKKHVDDFEVFPKKLGFWQQGVKDIGSIAKATPKFLKENAQTGLLATMMLVPMMQPVVGWLITTLGLTSAAFLPIAGLVTAVGVALGYLYTRIDESRVIQENENNIERMKLDKRRQVALGKYYKDAGVNLDRSKTVMNTGGLFNPYGVMERNDIIARMAMDKVQGKHGFQDMLKKAHNLLGNKNFVDNFVDRNGSKSGLEGIKKDWGEALYQGAKDYQMEVDASLRLTMKPESLNQFTEKFRKAFQTAVEKSGFSLTAKDVDNLLYSQLP